MHEFTPVSSLLGGLLIGLASSGVLIGLHRIAGVSSIVGGMFSAPYPRRHDFLWRAMFTLGLVLSGGVAAQLWPERVSLQGTLSLPWLVAAGLLVGIGTRLGSGCTSGHGVCGLSRFSKRSLVAVLTFMVTAGLTVFVVRRVLGVH
jgi:uncharacterized protein